MTANASRTSKSFDQTFFNSFVFSESFFIFFLASHRRGGGGATTGNAFNAYPFVRFLTYWKNPSRPFCFSHRITSRLQNLPRWQIAKKFSGHSPLYCNAGWWADRCICVYVSVCVCVRLGFYVTTQSFPLFPPSFLSSALLIVFSFHFSALAWSILANSFSFNYFLFSAFIFPLPFGMLLPFVSFLS